MSKTKFKLNYRAVGELMRSEPMQTVLKEYATNVKNRCGNGYRQDIRTGKTRANAMVWADTYQAKKDNLKNNTILKAVHR